MRRRKRRRSEERGAQGASVREGQGAGTGAPPGPDVPGAWPVGVLPGSGASGAGGRPSAIGSRGGRGIGRRIRSCLRLRRVRAAGKRLRAGARSPAPGSAATRRRPRCRNPARCAPVGCRLRPGARPGRAARSADPARPGLTRAAESGVHASAGRVPAVPGGSRRRAGAVMTGESVTLAGRAERAQLARVFVGAVLGPGHPCGEVAVAGERAARQQRAPQRLGPPGEDCHGHGYCRPGRGASGGRRSRRAWRPGAARWRERRGRGTRAAGGGVPGGPVGLAAARQRDGDLVRAPGQLTPCATALISPGQARPEPAGRQPQRKPADVRARDRARMRTAIPLARGPGIVA
jgi:hypothetical protein